MEDYGLSNYRGIYLVLIASSIYSASCQLSASPVLSKPSDTATFSWEIPENGLSDALRFIAINTSDDTMFILLPNGVFAATVPYRDRTTFLGSRSSRNITFTLTNIQTSDAGDYTCRNGDVNNIIANCGQKLIVLGRPTNPGRPVASPVTPVYNQAVTLTCSSTSTTVPADHGLTMTYIWQRDESDVTGESGSSYTFTVPSRDAHNYRCRARESQGLESADWSPVYTLVPEYGPYQISLTPNTTSYTVIEGQDTISDIMCSVRCNPPCSYRWLKNGTIYTSDARLSLGQAARPKAGSYQCQPYNTRGNSVSSTISVDVQYMASIANFSINSASGLVTVSEGDTMTLTCEVDSNPRSSITLLYGSEVIKTGGQDNSLTTSQSVGCRQMGNYSCAASNIIGTAVNMVVKLAVICSPRADDTFSFKDQYASSLGGNVTVSVPVLVYPTPTFTWSRTSSTSQDLTGSFIPVSDISVTIILELTHLQQQDFGEYNLTVENGEGEPALFRVSIVPAGPPNTPTDVTVTSDSPNTLIVSWKQGLNNGSQQNFTVEYSKDNETWNVAETYNETGDVLGYQQQTVGNLKPSTFYSVRIIARNKHGASSYTGIVTGLTGKVPIIASPSESNVGVIVGATVGSILLILIVVGLAVFIMRRGFRCVMLTPDTEVVKKRVSTEQTSSSTTVSDSRVSYMNQNQIPYSNLNREGDKQTYTELKTYVNIEPRSPQDASATNPYDSLQDTTPVSYETMNMRTYENTGDKQNVSPYEDVKTKKM